MTMESIGLHDTPQGASMMVRVQPRSRRNALQGAQNGALRLALTTPPVEGRANDALVAFLAALLRLPRSAFRLASGEHNRNKRVLISGRSAQQIWTTLAPLLRPPEDGPET